MRGDTPAPERRVYDLANEWFNLAKTIEDTDHITEGTFSVFCSDPKYPLLKVITLYAEAEGSVDVDSDIDKEGGGNDDTHDDGEEVRQSEKRRTAGAKRQQKQHNAYSQN